MNKGQITIGWIIGFLATTLVAASSSMLAATYAAGKDTDKKVEEVAGEIRAIDSEQDKDIAALVEAVGTIKEDNKEIKRDIKAILQAVK